jgi:hypothetical protein
MQKKQGAASSKRARVQNGRVAAVRGAAQRGSRFFFRLQPTSSSDNVTDERAYRYDGASGPSPTARTRWRFSG